MGMGGAYGSYGMNSVYIWGYAYAWNVWRRNAHDGPGHGPKQSFFISDPQIYHSADFRTPPYCRADILWHCTDARVDFHGHPFIFLYHDWRSGLVWPVKERVRERARVVWARAVEERYVDRATTYAG